MREVKGGARLSFPASLFVRTALTTFPILYRDGSVKGVPFTTVVDRASSMSAGAAENGEEVCLSGVVRLDVGK